MANSGLWNVQKRKTSKYTSTCLRCELFAIVRFILICIWTLLYCHCFIHYLSRSYRVINVFTFGQNIKHMSFAKSTHVGDTIYQTTLIIVTLLRWSFRYSWVCSTKKSVFTECLSWNVYNIRCSCQGLKGIMFRHPFLMLFRPLFVRS